MDVNTPGSTPRKTKNGLHLYPVSPGDSGEGLPYAPEDWPNPGDKWRWKTGKRVTGAGYIWDRHLYLPRHLVKAGQPKYFRSKSSVKKHIQSAFPGADVNGFFASFSWHIPSKQFNSNELLGVDSQFAPISCKADNNMCISLPGVCDPPTEPMFCDICCSEPGFCRNCCCILCSKAVCSAFGGYSYIRCKAMFDGYICGHVAHMACAHQACLAGTVGGTFGLDAEYLCRRCDSRTDLVSHILEVLQTCKSIDSRDEIEKTLNLAISLLHGSRKMNARWLLNHIESISAKLKNGANFGDVWKKEDAAIEGITGMMTSHKEHTITISGKSKASKAPAKKGASLSESAKPPTTIATQGSTLSDSTTTTIQITIADIPVTSTLEIMSANEKRPINLVHGEPHSKRSKNDDGQGFGQMVVTEGQMVDNEDQDQGPPVGSLRFMVELPSSTTSILPGEINLVQCSRAVTPLNDRQVLQSLSPSTLGERDDRAADEVLFTVPELIQATVTEHATTIEATKHANAELAAAKAALRTAQAKQASAQFELEAAKAELAKECKASKDLVAKLKKEICQLKRDAKEVEHKVVKAYMESDDFKHVIDDALTERQEEVAMAWLRTPAGQEFVDLESHKSFLVGQYEMQQHIYARLRAINKGFDVASFDLPEEMSDPEATKTEQVDEEKALELLVGQKLNDILPNTPNLQASISGLNPRERPHRRR